MTDSKFEPLTILRVLNECGVEYLIIGGLAGSLHGSDVVTFDLDVCYRRTRANIGRLIGALNAIDATLRGFPPDLPFSLDEQSIWNGDTFTFDTRYGKFDCLANPLGTTGYDDLIRAAKPVDIDGVATRTCSLDDLIRMKHAAGRPRDLWALEQLTVLKKLIDGETP